MKTPINILTVNNSLVNFAMTERVKKYLSILELSYCRDAISFRHSEMDFLFYNN